MIRRIDEPSRKVQRQCSCCVLSLQDYWLPTLAYFGGPAEIAYFAQVGVVYEKLLGTYHADSATIERYPD